MNKVLVITGPTASGKTALSLKLAKQFGNPIISADSRAIYKELTIGAAKPILDGKEIVQYHDQIDFVTEIDGVKHYLIDVSDLKQKFTVAQWTQRTRAIVEFYHERNTIPVIVGGTGLYIEALRQGYVFPPQAQLDLAVQNLTLKEKLNLLKEYDPQAVSKIDPNNPRRVERALALAQIGTSLARRQTNPPPWQWEILLIDHPRQVLYQRIDEGLEERLKLGLIEEVQALLDRGFSNRLKALGLEYRFVTEYLEGRYDLETMKQRLKFAIHGFARRQLTWWRKRSGVRWVSVDEAYQRASVF